MREETELVGLTNVPLVGNAVWISATEQLPAREVDCKGYRELRVMSSADQAGTLWVFFRINEGSVGLIPDQCLSFNTILDAVTNRHVVSQVIPLTGASMCCIKYINGPVAQDYFFLQAYLV